MPVSNVLKGKDEQIAAAIDQPGATPMKVAIKFGVYENSIRSWLKRNGYQYINGQWKPIHTTQETR